MTDTEDLVGEGKQGVDWGYPSPPWIGLEWKNWNFYRATLC